MKRGRIALSYHAKVVFDGGVRPIWTYITGMCSQRVVNTYYVLCTLGCLSAYSLSRIKPHSSRNDGGSTQMLQILCNERP